MSKNQHSLPSLPKTWHVFTSYAIST